MLTLLTSLVLSTFPPADLPATFEVRDADLERPHLQMYQRHAGELPAERTNTWAPRSHYPMNAAAGPKREVLGYLPYWELDYDEVHWDKLTTLAYFAATMDSKGDITDFNGWFGDTSKALAAEAKTAGVRYILTVVNFSSSSIDALVNDPSRRAHAVELMLDAVMSMGGGGVNIDFEGVPKSAKAGLVALVVETTSAFHAAIPGSQVTVATPAIDWKGAFDYDALAEGCDGVMIMAYGYHWKKGNPGPISPSSSGEIWGQYNLEWTILDYFKWGKEENRHKFILGLPFYGRDWPALSDEVPGKAGGQGSYVPFHTCKDRAEALGGFSWDEHSQTTYFIEQKDGEWRQTWCDDGPSWDAKLALVNEYDLGGVGIWALGYERGTTDLWESIANALIDPLPIPEDPEPTEPDPTEPDPTEPEPPAEPTPENPGEAPDRTEQPADPAAGDPTTETPDPDAPAVGPGDPERPLEPDATSGPVSALTNLHGGTSDKDTAGCSAGTGRGAQPVWLILLLLPLVVRRRPVAG